MVSPSGGRIAAETFARSAEARTARKVFRARKAGAKALRSRARAGRGVALRFAPWLALGDEKIAEFLVGWAAGIGQKSANVKPTNRVQEVSRGFNNAVGLIPEFGFRLISEAVNLVDTMTDVAIPDQIGVVQELTDIPEEAIRDALMTLSRITRALRRGDVK